jgi:hypothetical protein
MNGAQPQPNDAQPHAEDDSDAQADRIRSELDAYARQCQALGNLPDVIMAPSPAGEAAEAVAEPAQSIRPHSEGDSDAEWARIKSELVAYRDQRRQAWGNLDDITLARYLAGEATAAEAEQVRRAMDEHPKVRECVAIVREVAEESVSADAEPVSTQSAAIPFPEPGRRSAHQEPLVLRDVQVRGIPFREPGRRSTHIIALSAAASLLLACTVAFLTYPGPRREALVAVGPVHRLGGGVPSELSNLAEGEVRADRLAAKAKDPQEDSNAPDPTIQPSNLDPFWAGPAWKTTWDLAHLTAQDETHLGRELRSLIVQLNHPLETGPWLARVEEAAEPFLKARSRKDIDYTFTILDSDGVNAFSHPGGFVYVTRGLFDLIGADEDYALEFVIGHEIAHVDLQHALKDLRDPEVVKIEWGTLQKLYMLIIPFAYPDEQEFEADAWVYRRMRAQGRTDHECLAFLRKLEGYAQKHGFENGRGKPQPNLGAPLLENHLRAHTAARMRLKQLKELTGKASTAPK